MSAKDTFLLTYGSDIASAGAMTGIDPRLIAAQAGLESSWGTSALAKNYNNFFGIKATDGSGVRLPTTEYVGGRPVQTTALFETYSSPEEGFAAWGEFLADNPRYSGVLGADNLNDQIAALGKSGYATDPGYGSKLASIAKSAGMEALGAGLSSVIPGLGSVFGAANGIDLSDGLDLKDVGGAALGAIPGGELLGDAVGGIGNGIADAIKSFVDFFKNLFSVATAQRASLVLLGITLIIIAVIALVMQTKAGQTVAKGVTKAVSAA